MPPGGFPLASFAGQPPRGVGDAAPYSGNLETAYHRTLTAGRVTPPYGVPVNRASYITNCTTQNAA